MDITQKNRYLEKPQILTKVFNVKLCTYKLKNENEKGYFVALISDVKTSNCTNFKNLYNFIEISIDKFAQWMYIMYIKTMQMNQKT